jgi:pyridoxal phosphate enzyme (YggS family)
MVNAHTIDIQGNLERVRDRIGEACARVGRSREEVTLVAVSKSFPAEYVTCAAAAGQRDFGENYVQEARAKVLVLAELGLRWHFLGHLQRNKVRLALPLFHSFDSVDSLELGFALAEEGARAKVHLTCLLEVNIGKESSKSGFLPEALPGMEALLQLPTLAVRGLMAIPPPGDERQTRCYFQALRRLRDDFSRQCGRELPDLSMGMSDDYPLAVEEGATLVRVGRAIFGPRRKR